MEAGTTNGTSVGYGLSVRQILCLRAGGSGALSHTPGVRLLQGPVS